MRVRVRVRVKVKEIFMKKKDTHVTKMKMKFLHKKSKKLYEFIPIMLPGTRTTVLKPR